MGQSTVGWMQPRDTRDRRRVLVGLEGRRVTLLAGFRLKTKRTGRLFVADSSDLGWAPGLCPASVVVENEAGAEELLPMSEVFKVIDPETGATLGGPWR